MKPAQIIVGIIVSLLDIEIFAAQKTPPRPRWELRPPIHPTIKKRMDWLKEKPIRSMLLYIPLAVLYLLPTPKWLTILASWLIGMSMALVSVFLDWLEADKRDLYPMYHFWKRYDKPPENFKQFIQSEPRPPSHRLMEIWPLKPGQKAKTQRWLEILDAIYALPNYNQIPYEQLAELIFNQSNINVSVDTLYDINTAIRTGELWYSKEYHGL